MSSLPGVKKLKRMQQRESTSDTKKIKLSIGKKEPVRRSIRIANLIKKNPAINIDEFEAEKNSINHRLDHDCLANIFSYLSPVNRLEIKKVCKKWAEAVAMSWHNVKKLDTKNLPILIDERELTLYELLKKCCRYLTHLTIDYEYSWIAGILKNNCKNIVYFDVKLSSEYWSPIRNVIRSILKIKCLKAEVTSPQAFGIFHQFLRQLPVDIEEIHLVAFDLDEIPQDAPVLDKFSNLRCLTLRRFYLTTSTIKSILLNKNTLIYLDLTGCYLPKVYPKIFTELVKLEHLNLDTVNYINNNMIIEIGHNCSELKYFVLKQEATADIPRSIFRELKYLKNLEHLVFPPVGPSDDRGDNLMSDVVNNCKKLKHFNVEKGWGFLILDIEKLTKLNNLEYLNLRWAVDVDSQSFVNIANNCLELKELIMDFGNLPEITLEKLTNLKKLEKLDLNLCLNVTDNLLSKIANNCKNLVDLSLVACENVTKDSLLQVGRLQHLKKLDIDRIRNVPNAMFDTLHKLEYLSCFYCSGVTDEGIIKVIDNCQKLSYLDVWGTEITVRTLVHAVERQFAFKILYIHVEKSLRIKHWFSYRKRFRYVIFTD